MAELFDTLNPVFRLKTTQQWCEALRAMGVRYAPVRNYQQVAADPGVWENGYLQTVRNDRGEEIPVVGTPISMSETPLQPGATAPTLGEHTEEYLTALGLSAGEITELRQAGAI